MQYTLIKYVEVLLEFCSAKLRHNRISCHPTSTVTEKPCDSQRLPEVIIKKGVLR